MSTEQQRPVLKVVRAPSQDAIEGKCLNDVLAVFKSMKVNCWIDQGTLLGVVRDKKFLPIEWDHDFDLGVWWEDFQLNRTDILQELNSLGWKVCQFCERSLILSHINSGCRKMSIAFYHRSQGNKALKQFTKDEVKRPYLIARAIAVIAYIAEHIMLRARYSELRKETPFLFFHDLFFVIVGLLARNTTIYKGLFNVAHFFRSHIVKNYSIVDVTCDANFFEELTTIQFFAYTYLVPKEHEKYLQFKYGPTWRTPRKEWNYLEEDGGISKK